MTSGRVDLLVDVLTERLGPQLADAVADRVAERLADRPAYIDAAEVARLLSVSRDTVYELADELGAVKLGGGSRPRLRFERERIELALRRGIG